MDGYGLSSSLAASSSPSRPSTGSGSIMLNQSRNGQHATTPSSSSSLNQKNGLLAPGPPQGSHANSLSPVANRMRERDADAMEKYLLRNRSGSASTDNYSLASSTNGSGQASATLLPHGEEYFPTQDPEHLSGSMTPRRLRPSYSAAQLRTPYESEVSASTYSTPQGESRSRAGTGPSLSTQGRAGVPPLNLNRSSSISNSLKSIISPDRAVHQEAQSYMGPPSQYAQFPEPPLRSEEVNTPTATTTSSRRKALHILGKPLPGFDSSGASHRRGMSATSVRGP